MQNALIVGWTATASGHWLESTRPPQFAVDLLGAKIPIERSCQGAMARLRRRAP
jgi:hypothetical protein